MLVGLFGARGFDLRDEQPEFRGVTNHLRLGSLDLTFWSCTAASRSVLPEVDMVKQPFVLRGSGETSFGNTTFRISRNANGVVPAGAAMRYENQCGLAEYVLRIDATALRTKLGAMIGASVDRPIEFEAITAFAHPEQARLRRLIDHLVGELDDETTDLPAQALAQYQQSVMVCFLYANRHNFSHLLEQRQPQPALLQVHRAEAYIDANHSLPLTLEALTDVTGTGGLALSDAFRRTRGVTPLVFLKRVRLNYARRLLQAPEENTTVATVAYRFGFFNADEFASEYRRAFGEPPSATLADARRKRS
jgi:AraC-like DNA-binding protein